MRDYPIQTFLFWRTKDSIKVRKFMTNIDWDADLHLLYDNAKSSEGGGEDVCARRPAETSNAIRSLQWNNERRLMESLS